jgi:hypothetical protein
MHFPPGARAASPHKKFLILVENALRAVSTRIRNQRAPQARESDRDGKQTDSLKMKGRK